LAVLDTHHLPIRQNQPSGFLESCHIYKDVWAEGVVRTLLETLFSPRSSSMLPLA
jgi:hypothetical protein